jgi:nucleoside-diphosphate-sugar epimerase
MKVLFIGGTGNLSRECSLRALGLGMEVHHLNRGMKGGEPIPGVLTHVADINDEAAARRALGDGRFDSVVQFVAFEPGRVRADLELFRGRADQYVFISTASAYKKEGEVGPITEDRALDNPYWPYSRSKIECERLLAAEGPSSGMAVTVVRPSHTYGRTWIPSAFGSSDFTVAKRMLEGRPVIVPGDGSLRWTITHARDFAVGLVGLLGNPAAYGEAVHVTGDEAPTWDEIHRAVGRALGVEARIVHIPVEFIAANDAGMGEKLLGDKGWTTIFDCSKLKRLVPGFEARVGFAEGIRESVEWYLADPGRQKTEPKTEALIDRLILDWESRGRGR